MKALEWGLMLMDQNLYQSTLGDGAKTDKSFIGLSSTIWEDITWTCPLLFGKTIEIDAFICISFDCIDFIKYYRSN